MRLKIFLAGFLQVVLISINTWQLAHEKVIGAFIVAFLISMVWATNVRRIALGDTWDKFFYALGAAIGAVVGIYISKFIYSNEFI